MYFYTIYFLLPIYLAECISSKNLYSYVTQNRSQLWLKNLTKNESSKNPYCLICCIKISLNSVGKSCGKHTMCIYDKKKPGAACKGFISIDFTEDEIAAILDVHNTLRNRVAMGWETRGNPGPQPSASNMRAIEWDTELALLANRWAAQCVFAHDLCRDLSRYPVGQSIARGSSVSTNDLSFIVGWYDNVEMLSRDEIPNYQIMNYEGKQSPLPQYTQLVWAETYQIGCARVMFQQSNGSNVNYREHFICNYGPAGNIPGQPVYKRGDACSACPEGTGCALEYPGLCGREEIYEISYRKQTKKPIQDLLKDNSSNKIYIGTMMNILYLLLLLNVLCK